MKCDQQDRAAAERKAMLVNNARENQQLAELKRRNEYAAKVKDTME